MGDTPTRARATSKPGHTGVCRLPLPPETLAGASAGTWLIARRLASTFVVKVVSRGSSGGGGRERTLSLQNGNVCRGFRNNSVENELAGAIDGKAT